MKPTWGHTIESLTPDEIAQARRELLTCNRRGRGYCDATPAFRAEYMSAKCECGRGVADRRLLCQRHGQAFIERFMSAVAA